MIRNRFGKFAMISVVATALIAITSVAIYKYDTNTRRQKVMLVSALASSTVQLADSMKQLQNADQESYLRHWNLVRVNAMHIAMANVDMNDLDGPGLEGICVLLNRKQELYPLGVADVVVERIHRVIDGYFSERRSSIQTVLTERGYKLAPDGRSCVFSPNVEGLRDLLTSNRSR
ncbi:hypothetical protein [Pseudoduganella sp. OTU4001]|uniref:hypothetical protein n=1 Tax=Pseudoduganella sp. OTU4001 TaxID=3043854 RepID=UPI00313DE6AA